MDKNQKCSMKFARVLLGEHGDVALDPVVQALTLASGLLMLGNIVMSPLLVDLARVYGVSGTRIGLTMTVYNAPTVVLMFFIGALADQLGRKPLLIAGMILYTLSGVSLAFSTDYSVSLILRIVQGIGFALSTPIITAIIGDMYQGGREATAQGLRVSGNSFMSIVAPVFASSLMLISWRFPFLLFLALIPNILWIWIIIPHSMKVQTVPLATYFKSMFKVIRSPVMLVVNLTVLIRFLAYFGYLTYISFMGKEALGMTTMTIGIIIAAKSVLSLVGSMQTGRLSNKMHTAMVEIIAFLMAGAGLLVIGIWPSSGTLIVGSILYGLGDGILNAVLKSLINTLASKDVRGGAIAISTGIGNLGKSLAPPLMGIVLAFFGVAAIFTVSGILSILAALVSISLYYNMKR